jgi:hypothetical protein
VTASKYRVSLWVMEISGITDWNNCIAVQILEKFYQTVHLKSEIWYVSLSHFGNIRHGECGTHAYGWGI